MKIFSAITFFLLFLSNALAQGVSQTPAQPMITVEITEANGKIVKYGIPIYTVDSKTVISLQELSNALQFPYRETAASATIFTSIKKLKQSLTFKPQNHFAIIQGESGLLFGVIQLGLVPTVTNGKFYLTPREAGRTIAAWTGASFGFDDDWQKLSISFAPIPIAPIKPTPTDIVQVDPKTEIKSQTNKPTEEKTKTDSVKTELKPEEQKPESRFMISKYTVDEKANGLIIRIFNTKPKIQYEFIPPDKSGIAYLTFVDATFDENELNQRFPTTDFLQRTRINRLKGNSFQLTFEFNTHKYKIRSSDFSQERGSNNFIMLVLRDVNVNEILANEKEKNISKTLEHDRDKWKLDVITLDAGHGGKDPGTIGATGKYEKNIALGVVLKVGKLIEENWPDVKLVYTRNNDTFIELNERGKIANQANSKLFVSVHCNASLNKKADGVEVYLLGLHKTEAALGVAQRENEVINEEQNSAERYKDFTEENLIMVTMAQSAFLSQSQKLAEMVHKNIMARTQRDGRGVKQAGFIVLWTPSMPSILVETGYISNAEEEKFLASQDGQKKVAQAIFESIRKYKAEYEAQ